MPSKQRRSQAQAARQKVRDQMASDYERLAVLESRRAELLEQALAASQARRQAQISLDEAEAAFATAAVELVGTGLDPGEVAALVDVDGRDLRRILRSGSARKQQSDTPASSVNRGDQVGDGAR